jgi:dTDP-glucose 4,6-dehydratase
VQVLISGAAGFIGSHLVDRLLQDGHNVVGADNFITGSASNLLHLEGRPGWRFQEMDVTTGDCVAQLTEMGPFDAVFHLASLASPRDYMAYPLETLESGSTATRNLLEVARRYDATFLLTSTSECYGDPLEHPQKETYWGNVNPIGPRSCYDESKRYAEAITMAYHRKHGVKTNIARIFNTYGPRMKLDDGRVVPAFLSQAMQGKALTVFGDGTQTRSFCYVDDLVDGLIRLSRSEEREPVNLGNPEEITLLEFAERIQRLLGTASELEFFPLPENDPTRRQPDIAKAKRTLGWAPTVGLEEGLRRTVEYFQGRLENTVHEMPGKSVARVG